jgi:hypothetical protein
MVPAGIDFASIGATQYGMSTDIASAAACPSLLALNVRFNV